MSKKNETEVERKLRILKQSKPREVMPRPTIFKDKTKYDRNKVKEKTRKERDDY